MRLALALMAAATWSATILLHADEVQKSDVDRQIAQASTLFEQGRTDESRNIYESVLPKLRIGPPSSQLGFVLNGMSQISAAGGDYNGAIQFAKESAEIYHRIGDTAGESHSLNNQGIAEIQMGQYVPAQGTLEAALALSRLAGDSENQVQVLNNLGSSFYYRGSYSEALHRYDEAMNLVDHNGAAKWSDYWRQITSFNQATLFQRLGRYEKALEIYRQVEQSSKNLSPSDLAHLNANLGALYRRLGDPYKALDTYRAAEKLYAEQRDAGGELTVLKNIGIVYALDMDDLHRAQEIFRSSISLAQKTHNRREEMQSHLYLGEALYRGMKAPDARTEFEKSRALADELATTEEHWKSLYGLGRIEEHAGDSPAAESHYRQAIKIIEKTRSQLQLSALRSEFFADKRDAYDALIALLFARNDIAETFLFLEKSRARNFKDRLNVADHEVSEHEKENPLTIEQVRANLPPSTALFEFWTSGNNVGLVWCKPAKCGITLKQLSGQEMTRTREVLDGMPKVLDEDWRQRLRVFDSLLPDDAAFLQDVRHLIVVPDGWISYVPFDLLSAGKDAQSLLIERYDISYMPTAALLRRPRRVESWLHFPWTRELSAFGNPVVLSQEAPDSEATGEQGAQRLPFAGEEVRAIAALVHGQRQLFLQQDDLKKIFLRPDAHDAFLLHVSTHAFADGDSPENSRLLFSPAARGEGPDYVFLRELYDLDLRQVRLATISACDTERGKILRGEGVQAFSRALLSAGATSSLTTLWKVDDELTAEFMKQFYYLVLQEHKPEAEALRLAKLKFLQSNSKMADPGFWAAFVLNGDGATPLPSVLSWPETLLLLFGSLAVLSVFARFVVLWSRRRVDRKHRSGTVVS